MAYRTQKASKKYIPVNKSYLGETIEKKVQRITNNREPITDGAPLIYTDRKEGVGAEYDIRTDRFEVAVEAMGVVDKSYKAQREERHKPKDIKKEGGDAGGEPIQGTK